MGVLVPSNLICTSHATQSLGYSIYLYPSRNQLVDRGFESHLDCQGLSRRNGQKGRLNCILVFPPETILRKNEGTKNTSSNPELNPVGQTKKESTLWLMGQTPSLVGCLSCFQLYPLVVVKVNIFIDQALRFLEGGFVELT